MFIVSTAALSWWFIFLSPFFEIRHIKIKGSGSIGSNQIRSTYQESLEDSLLVFDSENLFYALLKKEKTKDKLKKRFPVFNQITITPEILTDTLVADFQERKKLGILKQTGAPNLYFDRQGVLFGSAPEYEGRLITLVEVEEKEFKKGDQIGPEDLKKSIITLLESKYLQEELNLSRIKITAYGKEIHAEILDGALLKFSIEEESLDPENIALLKKVMKERIGAKKDQLRYIDLRVPNRAYVQYEEESSNGSTTDN